MVYGRLSLELYLVPTTFIDSGLAYAHLCHFRVDPGHFSIDDLLGNFSFPVPERDQVGYYFPYFLLDVLFRSRYYDVRFIRINEIHLGRLVVFDLVWVFPVKFLIQLAGFFQMTEDPIPHPLCIQVQVPPFGFPPAHFVELVPEDLFITVIVINIHDRLTVSPAEPYVRFKAGRGIKPHYWYDSRAHLVIVPVIRAIDFLRV